jgi:hypothetical protein
MDGKIKLIAQQCEDFRQENLRGLEAQQKVID